MSRVRYIAKSFRPETLAIIAKADEILTGLGRQGYTVTLRQLYYQFVSQALIPNTERSYKRLGSIVSDGRLAGYLDWYAMEDRARSVRRFRHYADADEALRECSRNFALDLWEPQANRVEVWVEKEALVDVVRKACQPLDTPFFACKGYVSQSAMWAAAQRMIRYEEDAQQPVVIHLGDHDPSGIDMTRDIRDRFRVFNAYVEVERLALNMDQVEEYNPPPNPAKLSDSRASGYIYQYGNESWELDALSPDTMVEMITEKIGEYIDDALWEQREQEELEQREKIEKAIGKKGKKK